MWPSRPRHVRRPTAHSARRLRPPVDRVAPSRNGGPTLTATHRRDRIADHRRCRSPPARPAGASAPPTPPVRARPPSPQLQSASERPHHRRRTHQNQDLYLPHDRHEHSRHRTTVRPFLASRGIEQSPLRPRSENALATSRRQRAEPPSIRKPLPVASFCRSRSVMSRRPSSTPANASGSTALGYRTYVRPGLEL